MPHRLLRGQQETQDVQVELPVEVLGGHVLKRGELIDPGVVDQHIHPAERLQCFGEQPLDVLEL